ncbi:MAG: hypothetical protein F4X19_04165 [Acidobacteria bacterium]|nr:hypothetical protein [Acidobacteriota bacterium]
MHPNYSPEPFAKFAAAQVILPAIGMFRLFQYRVRPGEKCCLTTKSTNGSAQKEFLEIISIFLCFCAFCGHSQQRSRWRISQMPQNSSMSLLVFIRVHSWFVVSVRGNLFRLPDV